VDDARASERWLVAIATKLGAATTGGPLSKAEGELIAAAEGTAVESTDVEMFRARLLHGGDPLGAAFYRLRDAVTRRRAGAVYTPSELVEPMVRWTLDQAPARVVDAGSGSGRFAAAIARLDPNVEIVAVDLDPLATLMSRAALSAIGHGHSRVLQADYTKLPLKAIDGRTAFLGNPPYLRHHDLPAKTKLWAQAAATLLGRSVSGLAGLHALFYLATAHYVRPGDIGCFVTSAEWLEVNYGRIVRELLLHNLGGEALYVIAPESLPFGDTATTATIACFRPGTTPSKVRIRSVPTAKELPRLEGGTAIARDRLVTTGRWTHFVRASKPMPEGYVELGELCRVHRGAVTGANAVWVRKPVELDLPASVLFPSVTRARELFKAGDRLSSADALRVVVDLPVDLDSLDEAERSRVLRFLRGAKRAGANKGYVATNRRVWWRVGLREAAPILATYMARRAPAFVRNDASARHINIAHGLYPRIALTEQALDRLATALRSSVAVAAGRTYAGGLTKFEPREMERLPVPDLVALNA
jgi:SAM-dependent methyltransferase